MEITNTFSLPIGIYNAIVNDDYDGPRFNSDKISVTSLINPPRIHFLKKRHYTELTEDASAGLWRLMGHAVHAILQRACPKNYIVEERVEKVIYGVTISGKMDIMDETEISDYKITSVWQYIHAPENGKPEHMAQLNLLRWLVSDIFPKVSKLTIHMILRDWSAGKAKSTPDFPPIPFVSTNIPIWDKNVLQIYIKARVELFKYCTNLTDDLLPECSSEECWERPTIYAVIKDGGKRAIPGGLCSTMAEAENKKSPKMHIETRIGGRPRCAEYCVVKNFCNQYQKYLTDNPVMEKGE